MNLKETPLSQNYVYKGKIINMRVDEARLSDGRNAKREVVEHGGGVCVAALTENQEILMVKQFRYPYMEVIYEIPAGKRDKNEEPLLCGKRELLEETGFVADTYKDLGQLYPSPGYCSEIIWLYAAKNLHYEKQNLDDGEFLEVEKIPFKKAVNMVLDGEIKDGKTQVAILKLNQLIENKLF